MKTTSIYYICTDIYQQFLEPFLEKINGFMPQCKKQIIIITDSKENLKEKYEDKFNLTIFQHYIPHYIWPINTLFKMKYMLDFWHDADYAFYFNANLMPYENFGLNLDENKLYFAEHWFEFNDYKRYNTMQNPYSTSFIDYNNLPNGIKYCQGAFFGGNDSKTKEFCEMVVKMLKTDLLHNIIPKWHDESYLNKYLYTNFSRVGKDIEIIRLREVGNLIEKKFNKSIL